MATPETRLKAKIDKLLKSYGKDVWFFKPVSIGMGKHGVPDYIISANGYFLAVEAKASLSSRPTKLQELQLRAIGNSGAWPMVVRPDSIDALKKILDWCVDRESAWQDKLTT